MTIDILQKKLKFLQYNNNDDNKITGTRDDDLSSKNAIKFKNS